jgi:hypothetical protein
MGYHYRQQGGTLDHQKPDHRRELHVLVKLRTGTAVAFAAIVMPLLAACEPETSKPSTDEGKGSISCDAKPSPPYLVDGPKAERKKNFYHMTVRGEGDIACTAPVHQIKVTIALHHSTNGHSGAITGRDVTCNGTKLCEGFADFRRDDLYCFEVYAYDDYTQVTGWYKVTASSPEKRLSKESRHTKGSSYNPPGPCIKK